MTARDDKSHEGAILPQPATGAYLCESTARFADYWLKAARTAGAKEYAVMAAEQAINGWKNLAYDLARQAHYYLKTQAHYAESHVARFYCQAGGCDEQCENCAQEAPASVASTIRLSAKELDYSMRLHGRILILRERLKNTQLPDPQEITKELHALEWAVEKITTLAALFAPSATACSGLPPMNEDLGDILGRPNFTCVSIANLLRFNGQSIPAKAEDEQASCIYFLLDLYLKHGGAWREKAKEILGEINERREKNRADGGKQT